MNIYLLQHLLIDTAKYYSEKIALRIENKTYTYQFVLASAVNMAMHMKKNGLNRGDRIIVNTGNTLQTIIMFWATLLADCIISIIPNTTSDDKIAYILKDSDASVFITIDLPKAVFNDLRNFPDLKQIYLLNDNVDITSYSTKILIFVLNLENNLKLFNFVPQFKNNERDLASIIYTSGSTGEPKGVMLTHRNMLTATYSINHYLKHCEQDIFLSSLPLSFDYGLYQMIMCFSVGATLVLEKDTLFPTQLLKKIEKYQVTVLPCVPTLLTLLITHADRFKYNYASLRIITSTGAALHHHHITKVKKYFPHVNFFSMYGLTECKRCTYLPPDLIYVKPNSVGIAIPNTELWIVDENDRKVGANVVGQLVIRGATIMMGYWKKPHATDKRLKEGPIPGEKVLYTGDYALLDSDGFLYFKGRMDEVIKYKGLKVSTIELETRIEKISGINEVSVIGHENNIGDILLIICVSLHKGMDVKFIEKNIIQILPQEQQPNHILFFKTLPKNENGKINKKLLKERLNSKLNSNITTVE